MANSSQKQPGHRPGTVFGVPFLVLVVGAIGIVVAIGVGIALAGGDGGGGGSSTAPAFAPVEVAGSPLPEFEDSQSDAAVGQEIPTLLGQNFDGDTVVVRSEGEPMVIAFLAHWCPHCQVEVPRLVSAAENGSLDGIRLVGVATGTNPDAPNYPPAPWLERENWPGDVLVDDEQSTAASAFGLSSYPLLVFVDADGIVRARTSGEVAQADIESLAASLLDGS